MSRVAYVNGVYRPHGEAVVHIEDRGFQFADGVYEVWSVMDGRLADFDGHMARLHRSLTELGIEIPMSAAALGVVLKETVRRKLGKLHERGKLIRTEDGLWQVSRAGVDEHVHEFTRETVKRMLQTTRVIQGILQHARVD